jgi:hypothetical protein
LIFILALVAALFAFARHAAQAGLRRAEGWLRPLLNRLGLGGFGDGDDSEDEGTEISDAQRPKRWDSAAHFPTGSGGPDHVELRVVDDGGRRSGRHSPSSLQLQFAPRRVAAVGSLSGPLVGSGPATVGRAQTDLREPLLNG